jgi:hypothetical protein
LVCHFAVLGAVSLKVSLMAADGFLVDVEEKTNVME